MKKLLFVFTAALSLTGVVFAQEPGETSADATVRPDETATAEPGERLPERRSTLRRDWQPSLTAPPSSPELWLYEQERQRYEDPKAAVRRAAEYRMTQRHRRVESRKWFGYSNSRPVASPNPWYDTYSPMWVGNSFFPYEWSGVGPSVAVRPGWYGSSY